MTDQISPDEHVFRHHVAGPRFIDGVERGKWRLVGDVDWPYALVAVSAAPRQNAPQEFFLRFDLTGYPTSAPTATPWNPDSGDTLEADLRPKGEYVSSVFRSDWEEGKALYTPYDRLGLKSHPEWSKQHPRQAWNATRDLAWLLQLLHRMLNESTYTGI